MRAPWVTKVKDDEPQGRGRSPTERDGTTERTDGQATSSGEDESSLDGRRPLAPVEGGLAGDLRKQRVWAALFGSPNRTPTLGRFQVYGRIGEGGMGVVLEAYDASLDRRVAVKVLHERAGVDASRSTRRLVQEAQAMARLSHPNVVQVYEVGEVDGRPYIAMELVEGQTLQQWRRAAPRSWAACVDVLLEAGEGLAAAHARGLVHRDFKPANCIIDTEGRVRVLDFGLARDLRATSTDGQGELEPTASRSSPADATSSLTLTGTLLGTTAYMAPEQLAGMRVDARSDQFSFCVALFEVIFGQRPFSGSDEAALLHAIRHEAMVVPVPTAGGRIPTALLRVLQRGLASEPDARYPSMRALLDALRRLRGRRRRRWSAVGLGTLALVLLPLPWLAERHHAVGSPCAAIVEVPLAGWDDARRQAVQAAVLDAAGPTSNALWNAIDTSMAGYTNQWRAARAHACEQTRVQHVADEAVLQRRLRCLDRRGQRLDALTVAIVHGGREAVEDALPAVQSLPDIASCQRADAPVDGELPSSGPGGAQWQEWRREIDRIDALVHTGRVALAVDRARVLRLQTEAVADAHPGLHGEVQLVLGTSLRKLGHAEQAQQALEQALMLGERANDDWLVFDVAVQLYDLALNLRQRGPAHTWLATAEAKRQRLADGGARYVATLFRQGTLAMMTGDPAEAIARYRHALALLGEQPGGVVLRIEILVELAVAQEAAGDVAGALETAAWALELASPLGSHPLRAAILHNRGAYLLLAHRLDEAQVDLEAARAIYEHADGPRGRRVVRTLMALARLHAERGDFERAHEVIERAFEIIQVAPGVEPRLRGRVLAARANEIQRRASRADPEPAEALWTEALRGYREAQQAHRRATEPDATELVILDSNIADCLMGLGQNARARERYAMVVAALDEQGKAHSEEMVNALLGLARSAGPLGDAATERDALLRAASLLEQVPVEAGTEAAVWWFLASMRWEAKERSAEMGQAIAQARRAHERLDARFAADVIAVLDGWAAQCGARCR